MSVSSRTRGFQQKSSAGSSGDIFGERARGPGMSVPSPARLYIHTSVRGARDRCSASARVPGPDISLPESRAMISAEVLVGSAVHMFSKIARTRARAHVDGPEMSVRVPHEDFYINHRGVIGTDSR